MSLEDLLFLINLHLCEWKGLIYEIWDARDKQCLDIPFRKRYIFTLCAEDAYFNYIGMIWSNC